MQRIFATNRDQFLLNLGVNRAQLEALLLLSKQSPTIKYLAELLRTSTGAATQLVDTLAAKGFVERSMSQTDRRSVHVHLTRSGQAKFNTIRAAYLERLAGILGAVSDEQLDRLLQTTEQILNRALDPVNTEKGIS